MPIILNYGVQHRKVEKVFKKHWPILTTDKHLKEILPSNPKFTYRRAPTLRDKIARNVVDPPKTPDFTFFSGKGFFPCRQCYACVRTKKLNTKKDTFLATVTGREYKIRECIICHTEGVVYALQCP